MRNRLRYFAVIAALLVGSSMHGEICSEEVKLLLAPTELKAVIPALQAHGKTHGLVFFYDTPELDLLSKGVVLRFREDAAIDLTVKLRPISGEKFVDPSGGREKYKCEVDVNDGVEAKSFSVQKKLVAARAPETGEALFQLLSEGQKRLLDDAKVQIDWKRARRVADIRSTSWRARAKAPLGKLSLELWEWPGGSVLEVSAKVASDAGQVTYVELQKLAKKKGLALSANQSSKTGIALRAINAAH